VRKGHYHWRTSGSLAGPLDGDIEAGFLEGRLPDDDEEEAASRLDMASVFL